MKTVKEFIEELKLLPQDAPVLIVCHGNSSYDYYSAYAGIDNIKLAYKGDESLEPGMEIVVIEGN